MLMLTFLILSLFPDHQDSDYKLQRTRYFPNEHITPRLNLKYYVGDAIHAQLVRDSKVKRNFGERVERERYHEEIEKCNVVQSKINYLSSRAQKYEGTWRHEKILEQIDAIDKSSCMNVDNYSELMSN